ncbi:hypothetical protein PG994_015243 [Apiospora phragmitis]|uniref:Uncharacterized protein n=1 Tax=Apiospora phragmitis TaxID=2905665 RepID=A0ABR1SR06_9PEZI
MLNNSGNSRRPVMNSSGSAPQRDKSTRTQGKKNEDMDQPEEPERRSTRYEQDIWVDQSYYEGNPWYDQPKDKPVYSLGKTLPHTMRSSGQKKDMEEQSKNKDETSAAEEGQGDPKNKNMEQSSGGDCHFDEKGQQGPYKNQRQSSGNNNDNGGDSRNENDNHQDREDRGDIEPGNKYKADKDPMGGESEDKLARDGKKNPSDLRNWWARFRAKYPEPLAEFLDTGMSIFPRNQRDPDGEPV